MMIRHTHGNLFARLALAASATLAGFAPMSARAEAPSLDELLARAMENSPPVAAARAEKSLAEAKLNIARLEVARQIIAMRGELEAAQAAVQHASASLQETRQMVQQGLTHNSDLRKMELALIDGQARITRLEKELTLLAGQPGVTTSGHITSNTGQTSSQDAAARAMEQPTGPMAETIVAALSKKLPEANFSAISVKDAVVFLSDATHAPLSIDNGRIDDLAITLRLKDVPLGAVLQAIEDQCEGKVFVVREYGILMTERAYAQERGFTTVAELLKSTQSKTRPPAQKAPATRPGI